MNDQRSLYEQVHELLELANRHGLYDAADFLAKRMPERDSEMGYIGYDPIHNWFELSYASYLVVPRTVLQSMPIGLQWRFVLCLNEMCDLFSKYLTGNYTVLLRGDDGRFEKDDLANYQRGRRTLEPQKPMGRSMDEYLKRKV